MSYINKLIARIRFQIQQFVNDSKERGRILTYDLALSGLGAIALALKRLFDGLYGLGLRKFSAPKPLRPLITLLELAIVFFVFSILAIVIWVFSALFAVFGFISGRSSNWPERLIIWGPIFATVFLVPPFFLTSFGQSQAEQIAIYSLHLLSMNILLGFCGEVALSGAGFSLLGGYLTGVILKMHPNLNNFWPFVVLASGVVVSIVSIPLSALVSRVKGPYFSFLTIGFTMIVPLIIKSSILAPLTNGLNGFYSDTMEEIFSIGFPGLGSSLQYLSLMAFVSAALIAVFCFLERSFAGMALTAITLNEKVAASLGIRRHTNFLMAFVVSSFISSIAGSLTLLRDGFISPNSFNLLESIQYLTALMVCGIRSFLGVIVGAIFLVFLPNLIDFISTRIGLDNDIRWALNGFLIAVFVVFMPRGLIGQLKFALFNWLYVLPRKGQQELESPPGIAANNK